MGIPDGNNTEHNVHISVLASDQTLDIYKCTDPSCEHFCTKTNKRYHCPLCNNKPQKPGRMRRHFEKMHSSKQIVQHGSEILLYYMSLHHVVLIRQNMFFCCCFLSFLLHRWSTILAKSLGTLLQKHRKFAHSPSTPYAVLI